MLTKESDRLRGAFRVSFRLVIDETERLLFNVSEGINYREVSFFCQCGFSLHPASGTGWKLLVRKLPIRYSMEHIRKVSTMAGLELPLHMPVWGDT